MLYSIGEAFITSFISVFWFWGLRYFDLQKKTEFLSVDRFNGGDRTLSSLRSNGNGERIKLFHRGVHCSSTQCYSSESDGRYAC